jgi:outer membrane receptor for ferrienterochelin and colicins
MIRLSITITFIFILNIAFAQEKTVRFKVIDKENNQPIENVTIVAQKILIGKTNVNGIFTRLIAGSFTECIFSSIGYENTKVKLSYGDTSWTIVPMQKIVLKGEEVTIIASTRNNQKIENSPLKVEVLGREEMDEENTIKPANIASILGDISGVQIQQTSATTGNANVRIQGLGGQYTQILKDGMPLYEGFSGGFGVLSIPPLDLKQVELIKGSASTLYGGGAIGGLVNIISRKPTTKQDAIVTLNASTLNEKNVNFYVAKKYKKIGYTLFGGYTNQAAIDVNKDALSDVTKTRGVVIHLRLFFYPTKNTTIAIGENYVFDDRIGGDMNYINGQLLTGATYFYEKNYISRSTTDLVINSTLKNNIKFELKSSFSSMYRKINASSFTFGGVQNNFFSEASVQKAIKKNNLVGGVNFILDKFRQLTSSINNIGTYNNSTFGLFIQNTVKLTDKTIVEAGLRQDFTLNYGSPLLPRVAFIHYLNEAWALRAGVGFGYKIPNALNSQIKDVSITTILPIGVNEKAEKSIGYNAEINYKYEWEHNELFINHAFFYTNITSPIVATTNLLNQTYFYNEAKSIDSKGFDTYIKLKLDELELYTGMTYTIANRNYLPTNKFIPYTPKLRLALTALKENEEIGLRYGVEASFNGKQYRDDFTQTPSYLFIAALVEKKIGKHFTAVLNCENLLDYRQSKKEALFTGTIDNPQFKTLWAPIDGRVVNLAVRFSL